MNEKVNLDIEPIDKHIPVTCTNSMHQRYKALIRKLEDMGPAKKRVLAHHFRKAIEKVMLDVEEAIKEAESRSA